MSAEKASKTKLLLSGKPGCGKTTLIERIAGELPVSPSGFITKEIRVKGRRTGFEIRGFSGLTGVLAHVDTRSSFAVGNYGVDVSVLESVIESEFGHQDRRLVIIDEIGKMELYSGKFREVIVGLWKDDSPVIATIMQGRHEFCDRLKSDSHTQLLELTRSNRKDIMASARNFIDLQSVE